MMQEIDLQHMEVWRLRNAVPSLNGRQFQGLVKR
jgi:hypothetical protein